MIYFLEDDSSIRELVVYSLTSMDLPAQGFELPSELRAAVKREAPKLIILDIMLPEEDGISVLRWLRATAETASIPVIMLTARSSEFDIITALNTGADDYIVKPFGVMELVARVKAVLRRSGSSAPSAESQSKPLTEGGLSLYPDKHIVIANGEEISLTFKEFELLSLFLRNRGTVLDRDRILRSVWGYEFDGENRTVDVHIRSLRTKLGECGALIETVRGIGYKIGHI